MFTNMGDVEKGGERFCPMDQILPHILGPPKILKPNDYCSPNPTSYKIAPIIGPISTLAFKIKKNSNLL